MSNELELMNKVCDFYKYDIDKQKFKKQYRDGTIKTDEQSLAIRAIEFMMLRISEAEQQINEMKKFKSKDRPRKIDQEINKLLDAKEVILQYGDESKIQELLKELDKCIEDLESVKSGSKTVKKIITIHGAKGNDNIRFGYPLNKLKILTKSKELLSTQNSHIQECINLHLEYLFSDLEDINIIYTKEHIKQLFNYYFDIYTTEQ